MLDAETGMVTEQDGGRGGGDDEPGDEKIEGLKAVEADTRTGAKTAGSKEDNGRDNTEDRDVTKDGGGAGADAGEEIGVSRRHLIVETASRRLAILCAAPSSLRGPAIRAEARGIAYAGPAIGTERH